MKKLLFFTVLLFSLSGFSQDDSKDYKWLVGTNTGAVYVISEDTDGGTIAVDALYAVTNNLMVGAAIGLNFGDFEGEEVHIGARYYFGDIFAAASYDLGDTESGISIGLGYGWDVARNVEFAPRVGYNPEYEVTTFGIGFAIRF
tara:strand:- start:461 stop:892 length:432 start_codon:yes stop_codon:yes gene_type:complete